MQKLKSQDMISVGKDVQQRELLNSPAGSTYW